MLFSSLVLWRAVLAAAGLAAAAFAHPVLGGDRVALLLGNAEYANPTFDLRNPANDARTLGAELTHLGFRTDVLVDGDRAAARAALEGFAQRARGAEVALVFFAGHGVQIGSENHLLTAGFATLSRDQIAREALTLAEIRSAIGAADPELGIVVLDACRNNPLTETGLAPQGLAAQDLAQTKSGSGILIAYATDPGSVAFDGSGPNSVFTAALAKHIAAPGVEVRLMFGRVRQEVVLASDGRQVPWVEESVLGEHYLNAAPASAAPVPAIASDIAAWRAATRTASPEAYRTYLTNHPDGLYGAIAEERLARLAAVPPGRRPPDAASLLASADRERVAAALSTLGFLSATRGQPAGSGDVDLGRALEGYQRQLGGDQAGLDGLYLDAAQVAVMLGATTAQRIRFDMAALASIETTLGIATRARTELAALAEGRDDAAMRLETADADIAAIAAARETVLARLDQSRSYYGELVERASTHFRPYLTRSLAGLLDRSRSLPGFEGRVVEDAGRFVEHATGAGVARAEGSIAWLADFLPQD
jgi:hypothetical protein